MKLNIDKIALGNRIRNIRLDKGMNLKEFGSFFNAENSIVYNWEIGKTKPNAERMKMISKIGGVSVNELIYGDVEEFIIVNANEIAKLSKFYIDKVIELNKLILIAEDFFCNYIEDNEVNKKYNLNNTDEILRDMGYILDKHIEYIKNEFLKIRNYFLDICFNKDILTISRFIEERGHLYSIFDIKDFTKIIDTKDLSLAYDNFYTIKSIYDDYKYLIQEKNILKSVTLNVVSTNDIKNQIEYSKTFSKFSWYFEKKEIYKFYIRENKYNITDYENIIGLNNEKSNTMYLLANKRNYDDIKLLDGVRYFVLYYDGNYDIRYLNKEELDGDINSLGSIIYLAPIIGILE